VVGRVAFVRAKKRRDIATKRDKSRHHHPAISHFSPICVHLRLNSTGQKISISVIFGHLWSSLVIFSHVRSSLAGPGFLKPNRAKCKRGKEKVKFWMLYQRLTSITPGPGKEMSETAKFFLS